MDFFIQKSVFQDELSRLAGVIEKKSAIPILESIKITPDHGLAINLMATNLDLGIYSSCAVNSIGTLVDGSSNSTESICVPFRQLYDIVKVMPDGVMKVSSDVNGWIKLEAQRSKFKLPCNNVTAYPTLASPPAEDDWLNVPAKVFRNLLKGVEFAISGDEDKRYSISGIKIEINDSGIRTVATDGSRLSLAEAKHDVLLLNNIDILLPKKAVKELLNLISDNDEFLSIAITDNEMFFKCGHRIFYSRLLTGQFPNYHIVFKVDLPYTATFRADILVQSIKRAIVVAEEKLSPIVLNFKSDNKIHILASTADNGECNEILDTDFNGPEMRIACSGRFLLDYLEQMGQEKVKFEIKDSSTQLFIKTTRGEIEHQYMVAPMRDKGV